MLANINDSASLTTASWLYELYQLMTLRVDGLTLVVQKGADIGNAVMDGAIDPYADQLTNAAIKKSYLEVKSLDTKAKLRAAAARQASTFQSYKQNYQGGDGYKGKPYSPPMGGSSGTGGASSSKHPSRPHGGSGAAKST